MSVCKQKNSVRSSKGVCVDSLSLKTLVDLKKLAKEQGVKYTGVPKAKLIKDIRKRMKSPCKPGKKPVNGRCVLSDHLNRYTLTDIQVIANDLGILEINDLSKEYLISLITKDLDCDEGQYVSGQTLECTESKIIEAIAVKGVLQAEDNEAKAKVDAIAAVQEVDKQIMITQNNKRESLQREREAANAVIVARAEAAAAVKDAKVKARITEVKKQESIVALQKAADAKAESDRLIEAELRLQTKKQAYNESVLNRRPSPPSRGVKSPSPPGRKPPPPPGRKPPPPPGRKPIVPVEVDEILVEAKEDAEMKIDLLREQTKEIEQTKADNIVLLNNAIIKNKNVDPVVIKTAVKMQSELVKHSELEKMLVLQQAKYINGTTKLNKSIVEEQYMGIDSGVDIERGEQLRLQNEAKQIQLQNELVVSRKNVMSSIQDMGLKLNKTSPAVKKSISDIVGSPVGSKTGILASIAGGVNNLKPVDRSSKKERCSVSKMLWDEALQTCSETCADGKFQRGKECLLNSEMTGMEEILSRRNYIESEDDEDDDDGSWF